MAALDLNGSSHNNTRSTGNGDEFYNNSDRDESQQWLQQQDHDQIDAIPESLRFNWFDILCIVLSILTYVFDLGMDIYVSVIYYGTGYYWYFGLTLALILIPSLSMTGFSLRWYVIDMDNQSIPKTSSMKWIIRNIFLILQIAPVLRYIDALHYGLKSRRANDPLTRFKYYSYMINEDSDATLLRLFEAFLESAPQVTLQLYILIYHFNDSTSPFANRGYVIQILAVMSSLVSLSWSLSAYNRSLRYAQQDKINISYKGTLLQFLWHFCSISARVFALSVFAATHSILIFPVVACHLVAMLAWLYIQKTKACEGHCEEMFFNVIIAFIYIFAFFNVRDEPTRYKYLIFYTIYFLENSSLLFTWFFSFNLSTPDILWFRITGLLGDYVLFFLGIIFMIMYYVYFHPSCGRSVQKMNNPNQIRKASSTVSFPIDQGDHRPMRTNKSLARKGSIGTTQFGMGGTANGPSQSVGVGTRQNLNIYTENYNTAAAASRKLINSTIPKVGQQQTQEDQNQQHNYSSQEQTRL